MKKLFRFNRQLLADSLATTIEVNSFEDIKSYLSKTDPLLYTFLEDIWCTRLPHLEDNRLPEEWGEKEYYVHAQIKGVNNSFIIGFINFIDLQYEIRKL